MQCSCVILNYRDSDRTINLARTLASYDEVARVLVIDNLSPDDSWEKLQQLGDEPKVILIQAEGNKGYGAGNNIGLRCCLEHPLDEPQQLVMLANPDTMISAASIAEVIECFVEHPDAIVCAPWEYDLNTGEAYGTTAWQVPSKATYIMQHLAIMGRIKKIPGYKPEELTDRFCEVGCLSGALIMLNAEHYAELGLYNENIFLLCEETSLGVRSQGRFKTYLCTRASYTHEFSTSMKESMPNFRKRLGVLSRSRREVLEHDYKVSGASKLLANACYGLSYVEAFPLSWAHRVYHLVKDKKEQ